MCVTIQIININSFFSSIFLVLSPVLVMLKILEEFKKEQGGGGGLTAGLDLRRLFQS